MAGHTGGGHISSDHIDDRGGLSPAFDTSTRRANNSHQPRAQRPSNQLFQQRIEIPLLSGCSKRISLATCLMIVLSITRRPSFVGAIR